MTDPIHAELRRIADGDGPVSAQAKIALGDEPTNRRLRAAIRALAGHRGPASSTCPSDAARGVGGDGWRELMPTARDIARDLAQSGEVEITQRGRTLDPDADWHGPIRIRLAGH